VSHSFPIGAIITRGFKRLCPVIPIIADLIPLCRRASGQRFIHLIIATAAALYAMTLRRCFDEMRRKINATPKTVRASAVIKRLDAFYISPHDDDDHPATLVMCDSDKLYYI